MSDRTTIERPGLLDRMDRAVARTGCAIWRLLIDGFAAYGRSECGMLINPRIEHVSDDPRRGPLGTIDYAELRGDFETIDDLIRALQTVGDWKAGGQPASWRDSAPANSAD